MFCGVKETVVYYEERMKLIIIALFAINSTICMATIDLNDFQKPNENGSQILSGINQNIDFNSDALADIEGKKCQQNAPHYTKLDRKTVAENDLFIFVSHSMPQKVLEKLFLEAQRYDAVIVLRGLIAGSMKRTVEFFTDLIRRTNGGFIIEPSLFEKYHIQTVPAFVLTNGTQYDVIKGNITTEYALSKFGAEGDLYNHAKQRLDQ